MSDEKQPNDDLDRIIENSVDDVFNRIITICLTISALSGIALYFVTR